MSTVYRIALLLLLTTSSVVRSQEPCCAPACGAAPLAQAPAGPPQVELLYTGRLLGYVRADDPDQKGVSANFIRTIKSAKCAHPNALVVGMGDNLAPEFGSRFNKNSSYPKSRISFQGKPADFDGDIVNLFRQYYDVVVPGKEDFYFGAERLVRLAGFAPQINAANLARTVAFPAPDPEPNRHPRTGFLDAHPAVKPMDDGHFLLARSNGRHSAFAIELRDAETSNGASPPYLEVCPERTPSSCTNIKPTADAYQGRSGKFHVFVYDLSALVTDNSTANRYAPGTRHLFCFEGLGQPPELSDKDWAQHGQRYCRPMVSDASMFPDYPYSKVDRGGLHFILFPVVDPDVKKQIKLYDRTWDAHGKDYSVEVAFRDPVVSITQAYFECKLNHDCSDGTKIIVLAQMSLPAAEQLAPKLIAIAPELRLVISRAETPSSIFGTDLDYTAGTREVPVISPQPLYLENVNCAGEHKNGQAVLSDPLHLAVLGGNKLSNYRFYDPGMQRSWCIDHTPVASSRVQQEAQRQGNTSSLELFVAERLRDRIGGDAALVSTHEFYFDKEASGLAMDDIERIIWEGGHIAILRLSGKKLREALKASDGAPDDHKLKMAGIMATDDGNYYINGKPLDDALYYRVIAPDALVYGDPLYSALADETFQSPQIDQNTLAYFVCRQLGASGCNNVPPDRADPGLILSDRPPSEGAWGYVRSVFAPHHHDPMQKLDTSTGCPPKCDDWISKQAQLRPVYFAQLIKNDVSYSLSKAHPNDQVVGTLFGGVTDPRVVKAHTEVLSIDHDLRLARSSGRWQAGIEEAIQFGRSRQGSTTGGPDSVSLTANKATVGPFIEWAILRNAAPNWRFVFRPVDYSSNLSRTVALVKGANDATGAATSFVEDLPALRSLGTKFGVRFEAPQRKDSLFASEGNSFVEFGYKSTWNLNIPTELTLNVGTPFAKPCSLVTAKPSLATCASTVTAVAGAAVSQFDSNQLNGGYWSMLWRIPLGKVFAYKVGSDGEVRGTSGASAEARYAVSFDNYLQTRIWGNFGVAPHIGWFFYENQVDLNSLQRHSVDVTLTYNFNWHNGLGARAFLMTPATAAK